MVRTRIAPSPTGFPHIGTIYQVLFDWAFARKHGGKFVLRIEDTDRARFVPDAEQVILDSLHWFGLDPDESPFVGGPFAPYRQSERLGIYRRYVEQLVAQGDAYYCFCSRERLEAMRAAQIKEGQPPMYDKQCRTISLEEAYARIDRGERYVIRMRVPAGETIVVDDLLVGRVTFQSDLIDDQVLMKADGFPTYHLAVVVDDHLMEITHIFRGREWLPSTPKHILLYRFFGWEPPLHIHLPVILHAEGKGKLSKRHGHASVDYYRQRGFLPEAVLNYLSTIVWQHPDGKEIYSLEEFTRLFEISGVTSQGPKFDLKKLEWMNGEYIRTVLSEEELVLRLCRYSCYSPHQIRSVLPLVRDRLVVLSDFDWLVRFFYEDLSVVLREDYIRLFGVEPSDEALRTYRDTMFVIKGKSDVEVRDMLGRIYSTLKCVSEWNSVSLESALRALVVDSGWKASEVFMLTRVAVTGRTASPPLFETLVLIGRERVLSRFNL